MENVNEGASTSAAAVPAAAVPGIPEVEDHGISDLGVTFELRRCSTPMSEYPLPTEDVENVARAPNSSCFCCGCALEQMRYKAFLQQLQVPTTPGEPEPHWTMKHYGTYIPMRRPLNLAHMAMLIGGDFQMTTQNLAYQKTFIISAGGQ